MNTMMDFKDHISYVLFFALKKGIDTLLVVLYIYMWDRLKTS